MTADIVRFEVASPVGALRCAASRIGLALIAFPGSEFDEPLARLAADARVVRRRHPAATELRDWFAGKRRDFACALDLSLVSGFTLDVLVALRDVPFGELVTYGELAERAGHPRAARATGRAAGANPLPIVVP